MATLSLTAGPVAANVNATNAKASVVVVSFLTWIATGGSHVPAEALARMDDTIRDRFELPPWEEGQPLLTVAADVSADDQAQWFLDELVRYAVKKGRAYRNAENLLPKYAEAEAETDAEGVEWEA